MSVSLSLITGSMAREETTPLMKQYNSIKAKYPDAILLFRVGDFYETFGEDAIRAAGILGITLTSRNNGYASAMELAGFPYHALDIYLPRLVRAGQRVAICDQLEDPKLTKTIVKRGVTELVTPGVTTHENVLPHKENNFLACVRIDKKMAGLAFLDISTGEFLTSECNIEQADKLLQSFQPKEVLLERGNQKDFYDAFGQNFFITKLDDWMFSPENAQERLLRHFDTKSLKGFGVHDLSLGVTAAGAVLHYLDLTNHDKVQHISGLSRIDHEQYVWLDKFTIRNLELFHSPNENAKTLTDVLDHTLSPMSSRLLRRWIALPLRDIAGIQKRQNVVRYFTQNRDKAEDLAAHIQTIGDLERLLSRVAVGKSSPREVAQLRIALEALVPIRDLCLASDNEDIIALAEQINPCLALRERITRELMPEPPVLVSKGNVINSGVNSELDELREIASGGKEYLNQLQLRESERTGITSLKVSFNNVFGYYIEVRNTHKDKVPADWIRKQTLVSAERYITQELKEYETKIMGAEEKILGIETALFNDLVLAISEYIPTLQVNAAQISRLDVLMSFATVAVKFNYTCPVLNDGEILEIKQGRHPVIEQQLPPDNPYIANDLMLDPASQQIIMVTGPNMSGKSALLRQTALIVILAQMGCFVPAAEANIGIVDKVFTRVGASDNISQGESTFMVEMNETASILNNISRRSLVLLDEIGRGTSTYDGISIAWAIAEYIHEHPSANAKTLFATHYHELNEMEKSFNRIRNYNVSVKEVGNKVVFLRKLEKGGTEHSFGIHVARMAGMPPSLVKRASEILKDLERPQKKKGLSKPVQEIASNREGFQLSFFQLDDPVLKQIRDEIHNLDINNLTPVEALNKLNEIKKITGFS